MLVSLAIGILFLNFTFATNNTTRLYFTPVITNGKPLSCDWASPCPKGFACELHKEVIPDLRVCYSATVGPPLINEPIKTPSVEQIVNLTVNSLTGVLPNPSTFLPSTSVNHFLGSQCPAPSQVSLCDSCQSPSDCPSTFLCCYNGNGYSCTPPTDSIENQPRIMPIITGSYEPKLGALEMNGSVTLVRIQGRNVLIDTGTPASKNQVESGLTQLGLTPDDVEFVVITHGHPDHLSNLNLFNSAVKAFGKYILTDNVFSASPLMSGIRYEPCFRNFQIIETPGHTPEDVSVVLENVLGMGRVAITGDLFIREADVLISPDLWKNTAWNTTAQLENRRKIACAVDWILPGHGPVFRVNDDIKTSFQCYKNRKPTA